MIITDPSTQSRHFHELVHIKYQLPRRLISKRDWAEDVARPLQVTIKDIFSDLQQYANGFPRERIPHCSDSEKSAKLNQRQLVRGLMHGERINADLIDFRGHGEIPQYILDKERTQRDEHLRSIHETLQNAGARRRGESNIRVLNDEQKQFVKKLMGRARSNILSSELSSGGKPGSKTGVQTRLHFLKQTLDEALITQTFDEIRSERLAKLIGLCCHFSYWCVFGRFNAIPIDEYHLKQLFISMLQTMSQIEAKYTRTEKAK